MAPVRNGLERRTTQQRRHDPHLREAAGAVGATREVVV